MIERVAERLAIRIHQTNKEETASVPVLTFALIGLINNTITLLLIMIAGQLLGIWREALLAFVAFMVLRIFAGGFHFRSVGLCTTVTVFSIVFAAYLSTFSNPIITWLATAISLLLSAIFAPSNIKKTRIKPSWRPIYKLISMLIIALNFYFQSPLLALTFLVQAISTIEIYGRAHDEKTG